MANLATNETYSVWAIAPSGNRKRMAERVGAFKASRLAKAIEAKGFGVDVVPTRDDTGEAVVIALRD